MFIMYLTIIPKLLIKINLIPFLYFLHYTRAIQLMIQISFIFQRSVQHAGKVLWLLVNISHFVECDHCLIHGSGQEETLVNAHMLLSFPRIDSFELFVSKTSQWFFYVMTQLRHLAAVLNSTECMLNKSRLYYVVYCFFIHILRFTSKV